MPEHARSILRTTAALSIGTLLAQALGTASQLLLAAWLTPADFGLFAIANLSLIALFALVNLGEVSAFLSDQGWDPRSLARETNRFNVLLVGVGLCIALIFWLNESDMIAILVTLLAVEVPLMGRTLVLYAVAVKVGQIRLVVLAQVLGSLTKLVVGVSIAWSTQSPVALAVSLMSYSLVMILPIEIWMRRTYRGSGGRNDRPPLGSRFRWALQSLSQALPAQADYLVVSVVSVPQVLGVYFFSYQATVGLSTLLSGPLMKSSLAEFGRSGSSGMATWYDLASQICRAVAAFSLTAALAVYLLRSWLPDEWGAAGPVLVILLGSLAARFVTPITEARQVSDGRWTLSTWLNAVDAVGTAGAALAAISGSVLVLAYSVAGWKLVAAATRATACIPGTSRNHLVRLMAWPFYAFATAGLGAWYWDEGYAPVVLGTACAVAWISIGLTSFHSWGVHNGERENVAEITKNH